MDTPKQQMTTYSDVLQPLLLEGFLHHLTLNFFPSVQLLVLSAKHTGKKPLFVVMCPAFLGCYVPPATQFSLVLMCTRSYSSLQPNPWRTCNQQPQPPWRVLWRAITQLVPWSQQHGYRHLQRLAADSFHSSTADEPKRLSPASLSVTFFS